MGTVSVSLPSDGQTIDAADYNTPINTIVSEINGSLDSNNIAEGGVVPNSLVDGTGTSWVWQDWTPTYSGITVGNGTVVAKYAQIGKLVKVYWQLTLGSTSAITGASVTLPVTAASDYENNLSIVGWAGFNDNGVGLYVGKVRFDSTTQMRGLIDRVDGTYSVLAGASASTPFTWTTGDKMTMTAIYQAA